MRFNSATDFCLWKLDSVSGEDDFASKLQFGHRFLSVEMAFGERMRHVRHAASIRPQIFVCGNPIESPPPKRRTVNASIRPQIFVCGNRSGSCGYSADPRSCFNSATDFCLWKFRLSRPLGRGISHAGFNSATDFCLWKCANRCFCYLESQQASIRPQIFVCGNHSLDYCTNDRRYRFNSATDFCLWKYYLIGCSSVVLRLLQFGHRFLSVEIAIIRALPRYDESRFNSATDFCLWKFHNGNLSANWLVASIRPQIFVCGNAVSGGQIL
ncbi:unnamed protein product [Tuwongella immobilis]|uniref:Uncharacterized protein n=1 Tax=Tuwongella immobilis TaxID=692036 RepID=A0A6C2YUZ7_9BACT|nr:unnamed protein product [Tuwongella immobilis]VTS07798.1 unnamed protein product [Tuwongella immobilis]